MATAANLDEAAEQAYANLQTLWIAGTMAARMTSFVTDLLPTFPEQEQLSHPVSNWLVLIRALSATMNANASADAGALRDGANYVYRICLIAQQLQTQSMITGAQAAAVLTAYNLRF